jgi:type II secretory pathway component GspD/PulD (secretin)
MAPPSAQQNQPSSSIQESATAETGGKKQTAMIRIETKVVQFNEDDYQAHRSDIDAAVAQGNLAPLVALKPVNLISEPAALTKSGERAVMEAVRVFPYASVFEKEADGKIKATKFTRQDLGFRCTVLPVFHDGKIMLKGGMTITSLVKLSADPDGRNPRSLVVKTRELGVSETLRPGDTKGFEVPGDPQIGQTDSELCFLPNQNSNVSPTLRRTFLFLNVQVEHADNTTCQPSNQPTGAVANTEVLTVRTFLIPVGFFQSPLVDNADVKPELIARGIAFPVGATAVSLASGKVVVRNTPDQLDKLATLIQKAAVPGGKIEIGLKAIEIPEDIYLANKAKVDAAVENADLGFFMQVKGVVIVSTPTVTTMPGTKATIEIVREFPYPVTFEPAKLVMKPGGVLRVPPTPHEFVTKDVGLSAEITPTINAADSPEPGKIMLTGKFTVTEFEGFTASNLNVKMPAFDTRESFFIESLSDRETKGIWIPGVRGDEQFVTDTEKAGAMRSTKTVEDNKRLLLFVSARRFP